MESKYRLRVDETDDYSYAVVIFGEGEEEIGTIGGEPEDATYYRDYAWVVPALNEAYRRGLEAGQNG